MPLTEFDLIRGKQGRSIYGDWRKKPELEHERKKEVPEKKYIEDTGNLGPIFQDYIAFEDLPATCRECLITGEWKRKKAGCCSAAREAYPMSDPRD
jgi:hypothetical protein